MLHDRLAEEICTGVLVMMIMLLPCALIYSLAVSLSDSPFSLSLAALLPLCLVLRSPEIVRSLVKVNAFSLVLIMTLALTWPDFRDGVMMGIVITARLNMIYIVFGELVRFLGVTGIYAGLVMLRVPEKLRVLLLLTLRGVNIMRERLDAALISLRLRGPELSGIMRLKTFAYVVSNVLLQSASRSDRMSQAITCRGGFGGFHQTEAGILNSRDIINLTFFMIYSLAIMITNYA